MREELFGPVVTTYVYDENKWDDTLELVDTTAPYGLTGAVFSEDRAADRRRRSRSSATRPGNFYVNDKPTGAVVGQQPFGGARASGTNDKAGSMWNLIRWVSPRSIKETFTPPTSYRYPFMDDAERQRREPEAQRTRNDQATAVPWPAVRAYATATCLPLASGAFGAP